jgi:hypothetical protein
MLYLKMYQFAIKKVNPGYYLGLLLLFTACKTGVKEKTFGDDVDFVRNHRQVVLLKNDSMQVLVVPGYQARVMTSTAGGATGSSYGWMNYDLIGSGRFDNHINAYGGEERIWLGPEGGQYGLFFKKGQEFTFANWQTPGIMDTASFDLVSQEEGSATFAKTFALENYSGTKFSISLERKIALLHQPDAEKILGVSLNGLKWVGYQSENRIVNSGQETWDRSSGLLSVWLLSMLRSSQHNTILIPYKEGTEKLINDRYFGKVPAERLSIKNGTITFTADADYRSKIGVPPEAVKPFAGSYDAERNILTILAFDFNYDTSYVNSAWKIQPDPYKGDVLNAYNDGPNDEGKRLGSFYELESSSPAQALPPGASFTHRQRMFHLEGPKAELEKIAKVLLGHGVESL